MALKLDRNATGPDEEPTLPRTPSGLMAACKRTEAGDLLMPEAVANALVNFWKAKYAVLEDRVRDLEADVRSLRAELQRPGLARAALERVDANPNDPRRE